MSRCFPFPPPGYERTTKADEPGFLKKEKHREKKHKKEKRDKEKKEGKEKREKERSDEKLRGKKDKKEKHRDTKNDKDKDRDKDKHTSGSFLPDEKRVVGPFGAHLPMPSNKSRKRENDRSATSTEKSVAGLSVFRNGEQVSRNNHPHVSLSLAPETKIFGHTPELGQRRADDERRTPNHLPDNNVGTESKKNNQVSKLGTFDGRMDGRDVVEEARSSVGMVQIRVGGEKKVGQGVEGKEKIRDKGDDRKGEKKKEKDGEKPIHKDKELEMEKKKEEKVKAMSEQKHIEQSRVKVGIENHLMKSCVKDGNKKEFSSGLQNIQKDSNLGKRKDIGLNGVYDEHTTGPNKLARTFTASPHPLTENGRSLEPCQNSTAIAPATTQKPPMNIKVDGKGRTINGMVPHPGKHHPSQSSSKSERKPDISSKPPHPDTKYLREVLSVPKMDERSDFDDQEWLFNSCRSQTVKPETEAESCGTDKTPQVWEKALWLEPVDVYALPYVIPH